MNSIENIFSRLSTEHAPGQEGRLVSNDLNAILRGDPISGVPVDFSHGDVNKNAFAPPTNALEEFLRGYERGGSQAYTEYRGDKDIRAQVAAHLATFTGHSISAEDELIITPGTQGALFLALAATVTNGDRVAIVRPDYFANRKLVEFLGAQVAPINMKYLEHTDQAGIDLQQLEEAFESGAKVFLFSNPNNPTGVVYSDFEIRKIAELAARHDAIVIVDQLYSRLLYTGEHYVHLRSTQPGPSNVITIMGPSKTESLSGFRLGVAFGPAIFIDRMEKLQAIVSLRAPGYSQAVLFSWFNEPEEFMSKRIKDHESIRDAILNKLRSVTGLLVRTPQAGSYVFPTLPTLCVSIPDFVRILRVQAQVTVTTGTEFDPDNDGSIRLNFSQNPTAALDAIDRLIELIDRYQK